uniref:Uncharacterized protein n=1 Tax=Arundo donax TaxID=35708 RepID=A0A0A9EK17_ARUDO
MLETLELLFVKEGRVSLLSVTINIFQHPVFLYLHFRRIFQIIVCFAFSWSGNPMGVWINCMTVFQVSHIPLILDNYMMFSRILTCSYCGFKRSQT